MSANLLDARLEEVRSDGDHHGAVRAKTREIAVVTRIVAELRNGKHEVPPQGHLLDRDGDLSNVRGDTAGD